MLNSSPARDVVYTNCSIITQNPAEPTASAMWVHSDRIAAVGGTDAVLAAAPPLALVVPLDGMTILPGLIDAHCHLTWFAYLLAGIDCSPKSASSIVAIQEQLTNADPGGDGWVTGSGFAEYKLQENRAPTRDELDEAVPNLPCVLFHTSLHVCVVNSAGLSELGLSDSSDDPPRGRLGRDSGGRLNGMLLEEPVFELMDANMQRHLDSVGPAGRADLIKSAAMRLASLGITSCTDASTTAASFANLRQAEASGQLPIRVTCMFTFPEAAWLMKAGMTAGFGSDNLRIGAVKVWADGGMSSRTAAVDEPYLDPPGETGIFLHEEIELRGMISQCEEAGFQIAIHAQGDRAIRVVLQAFETSGAVGNPLRHRIEHGGAFRPDLQVIAANQGIHVVSQPAFISQLGDGFIEAFGPERSEYLYPYASLGELGVVVAGSSDTPVCDPSPFIALRDAILRTTNDGAALAKDESVSPSKALDFYTRNAAFVGWADDQLGTLEAGKLADFVVVNQNPLTVSPESIAETEVRLTVVGGQIVFNAGEPNSRSQCVEKGDE